MSLMLSSKLGPVFFPRKNTFLNFMIYIRQFIDSFFIILFKISWLSKPVDSFHLLNAFVFRFIILIFVNILPSLIFFLLLLLFLVFLVLVLSTSYKLWEKLWFFKMPFSNLPLAHSRDILCSLTTRILPVTPSLTSVLILWQLFM